MEPYGLGTAALVHEERTSKKSGASPYRTIQLLSRARLADILRGRSSFVGTRLNPHGRRGWVSPVEARIHLGIPYGDLLREEAKYLENRNALKDAGVLLRACISSALSLNGRTHSANRPKIVSARVDTMTIDGAVNAIISPPPRDRARIVHIVHPHALNLARFDKHLAGLFDKADLVLPDGIGLRLAAAILGISLRHNLNGTDLLPLLCVAARDARIPLVLIGGAPGVAEECAARLRQDTPGLSIPYVSHGYLNPEEATRVRACVRQVGRCIVLVGMGTPIQETWTWAHLASLEHATVITVGGLFDFFSGRIPRAPVAWRELGLEWLWRLKMEPRRLAKRYLLGNPLFVALAVWQLVTEGRK
jgi:N-acetylglucosaminyldiphosphoundecaprenol N-acetyl-beta-D-mannosaminyltransferase